MILLFASSRPPTSPLITLSPRSMFPFSPDSPDEVAPPLPLYGLLVPPIFAGVTKRNPFLFLAAWYALGPTHPPPFDPALPPSGFPFRVRARQHRSPFFFHFQTPVTPRATFFGIAFSNLSLETAPNPLLLLLFQTNPPILADHALPFYFRFHFPLAPGFNLSREPSVGFCTFLPRASSSEPFFIFFPPCSF